MKARVGFEQMTYRFVFKALIHCATLLGNNLGWEEIYEIILNCLDSAVYFD